MNKWTFTFLMLLLILVTLLIVLSMQGNFVSMIVLAVLATIALVVIGATITLVAIGMANKKAQLDFANNAKENLAIMSAMQTIQNKQNSALMQQVRQLPEPQRYNGNIIVEDGVFDDLEDLEL